MTNPMTNDAGRTASYDPGPSRTRPTAVAAPIPLRGITQTIGGYGSMLADPDALSAAPDVTTEEYHHDQVRSNARITREYLEPIIRRAGARRVLDVGCGVGKGVLTLLEDGVDAYGVDLPGLTKFWSRMHCPSDRFFVVPPTPFALPFPDATFDFAYSFGVIEHVGTVEGGATRRPDYHDVRRQWLREIYRVVKPGGHVLVGGPNRGFPVDASHALDSEASALERWLSAKARLTVHRTWGQYFLWGYSDVPAYLEGLPFTWEPLSIRNLLVYGRAPAPLRPLVSLYVDHLPRPLLGTGFNPWVMALIRRTA